MKDEKVNTNNIELFWTLLNEILTDVSGKKKLQIQPLLKLW